MDQVIIIDVKTTIRSSGNNKSPRRDGITVKYYKLVSNLGPFFFHADTGPSPTRPANRSDSVGLEGNFWIIFLKQMSTLRRVTAFRILYIDHNPICS